MAMKEITSDGQEVEWWTPPGSDDGHIWFREDGSSFLALSGWYLVGRGGDLEAYKSC